MFRINWKYTAFLGALIGLYFLLLYFMPQKFNWFITLYQKDKDPFGTYVFKSLIDNSWLTSINTSNQTLYELDELPDPNLLVLCEHFKIAESERETLLGLVEDGKTAIISAHQIDTAFNNLLGVHLNSLSFNLFIDKIWGQDSLGIKYIKDPFDTGKIYWLPEQLLSQFFETHDPEHTEIIAENTNGKPVLLKIRYGKGTILLSSTPLMFSNFAMIKPGNYEFIAGMFSFLPSGSLHWTEYYQLGRMEAQTPLRYVLSEPSLKWALYIVLITILISMFFKAKRMQRVIPVMLPPKNETLDFVKTISRLYYQKKDHKDLAVKKMLHFTEYLKRQLQIDVNEEISEVISKVAAKTGNDEHQVKMLFDQMNIISNASYISAEKLQKFMDGMEVMLNDDYKQLNR